MKYISVSLALVGTLLGAALVSGCVVAPAPGYYGAGVVVTEVEPPHPGTRWSVSRPPPAISGSAAPGPGRAGATPGLPATGTRRVPATAGCRTAGAVRA